MTKRKTLEDIHEDAMRNITEHLKGFSHKLARRNNNGTLTDIEYASANVMLEQQIAMKALNQLFFDFKFEAVMTKQSYDTMRENQHDLIDDIGVLEEHVRKLTTKLAEAGIEYEQDV